MPSTLAVLPCVRAVAICLPLALVACGASPPAAAASAPAAAVVVADCWRADLAHDGDECVWYAKVDKVVAAHGANEVVVTDDAGRFTLLTVYSGQWTAHSAVGDGQWLAPAHAAEVAPRVPGAELYAAGKGARCSA
ncbi:MAG: hypothetical protein ACK595_18075 [Planctomycetota bacterium]